MRDVTAELKALRLHGMAGAWTDLVAQGGGPTAVINQSLAGVVLEARRHHGVRLVYGARHGVRGIVDEDFVDLTQETSHNLEQVAGTPASALGSTRDKPDLKYCQEIFKVLQAHEIEHFFYIGGNDSSDTVRIVAEEARAAEHLFNQRLRAIVSAASLGIAVRRWITFHGFALNVTTDLTRFSAIASCASRSACRSRSSRPRRRRSSTRPASDG